MGGWCARPACTLLLEIIPPAVAEWAVFDKAGDEFLGHPGIMLANLLMQTGRQDVNGFDRDRKIFSFLYFLVPLQMSCPVHRAHFSCDSTQAHRTDTP